MEFLKLQKFNKVITGIVLGTIVPVLLYFVLVAPKMRHYSFMGEFYQKLIIQVLPFYLSRCIFPNAILFFLLLWINYNKTAKGVLIITGILTVGLFVVNYIILPLINN